MIVYRSTGKNVKKKSKRKEKEASSASNRYPSLLRSGIVKGGISLKCWGQETTEAQQGLIIFASINNKGGDAKKQANRQHKH